MAPPLARLALVCAALVTLGAVAATSGAAAADGPSTTAGSVAVAGPGIPSPPGGACTVDNPPCGWIDPVLDVRLPEKRTCEAALGSVPDPATCHSVPAPGEPLVLEGTVVWWWDISQDGTYPLDPAQDVVISFGATQSAPDWLTFTVEPAEFVITNQDLVDPANMRQEEVEGSAVPRLVFWFERPITLTVERTGEIPVEDIDAMSQRGYKGLFVKAQSTPSGDRFRASFGIEEIRFTGPAVESRGSPSPLLLPVPLLAAWALRRAARQDP